MDDRDIALEGAVDRGIKALKEPPPMKLSTWADNHFYLSAESSYVEGKWESFPYQVGIMDCMSNDDIREITWMKSARVGSTKLMLAAIGYFASHKRRNQAFWQPVDDDADEFVKTELDPMLRDVKAVKDVFPWAEAKHKNNTMRQKVFLGATLHIRGGKAAKNYRRISPSVVYLDEVDGFDRDIEREGDPISLAEKRVEGAVFPKVIIGSTPKTKGQSMIEERAANADRFFRYHVPCPHCNHMQYLVWGGKEHDHGFKWEDNDPATAEYLCCECHALFPQSEYLKVWGEGRWIDEEGVWIDPECVFRDIDDDAIFTPATVAFHIWTAYSSMTSWTKIVDDFIKAKKTPLKLKAFVNTTLGETWDEDPGAKMAPHDLMSRREVYDAEVPDEVVILTIGADTQDNRVEYKVKGWSAGEESWLIDYQVVMGDLAIEDFWRNLNALMRKKYHKASGEALQARMVCHDAGGHFTDEVYSYSRKAGRTFIIPTMGSAVYGKPVATFPLKPNKHKVYLTMVGTDTAKDLVFHRFGMDEPGDGYCHFPDVEWCNDKYFKQLTAETRKLKYDKTGNPRFVWHCPSGVRNEAWDCEVLNLVAIRILQQYFGVNLEELQRHNTGEYVQPVKQATRRQISAGVSLLPSKWGMTFK